MHSTPIVVCGARQTGTSKRVHLQTDWIEMKVKVVVVGAGIAGIVAAAKLINNGIEDVVVLEAQDYIGGRMKGIDVDGTQLDMGAMFIHGQHNNPLYEIAKKIGVAIVDDHNEDFLNMPKFFYTSKREKVSNKIVAELVNFMTKKLEKKEGGVNKGDLISQFYDEFLQLHEEEFRQNPAIKEYYTAAYRWYILCTRVDEASNTLDDVSIWADRQYTKTGGNNYVCIDGGYRVIIDSLLHLIPSQNIKTGTPVSKIEWSGSQDDRILVTCENGDIFNADHVINTMGLRCLQNTYFRIFSPALPTPFTKLLSCMKMGAIGKIFLKWEKPFWEPEMCTKDFLWMESQPITLKADKSKKKTWLGVYWWEDVFSIETVEGHDNILLVWLMQHQMEVIHTLEDSEVMAVFHELLQTYIYDLEVPMPVAMFKTSWYENPWVGGTYSYIMPNIDIKDVEHLNKPIPSPENPKLLFAGEAHTLEFMTTAHGAFMSGEEQAERLLQIHGITNTIRVVDLVKA